MNRLITQYQPAAICLQHIGMNIFPIQNYSIATQYKRDDSDLGTAILVHNHISYENINIPDMTLQATGIKLVLDKDNEYYLFNLYNQPSKRHNVTEMRKILTNFC